VGDSFKGQIVKPSPFMSHFDLGFSPSRLHCRFERSNKQLYYLAKKYKSSSTLSTMKFLMCSHQVLNVSLTFPPSSQCVPKDSPSSNTPCPITFAPSWTFITLCRAKRREPNNNFILGCNLLFSILRGCLQSFKFRNYALRASPPTKQ
jgi:hypothetical protein